MGLSKEECESWANKLIGYQGGNRDSSLWFCGLEYQDKDLKSLINDENILGNDFLTESESEKEVNSERFNKAIVSIAKKLLSNPPEDINKKLFTQNGPIYKINLYPPGLSRTDHQYSKDIIKHLNYNSKSDIRNSLLWGEYKRFRKLNEIVTNKSRLIICCSRNEESVFKQVFLGIKNIVHSSEPKPIGKYGKKSMKYITIHHGIVNNHDIVLAIVPFLSGNPSSPTSENEKDMLTDEIKEFLKSRNIKSINL